MRFRYLVTRHYAEEITFVSTYTVEMFIPLLTTILPTSVSDCYPSSTRCNESGIKMAEESWQEIRDCYNDIGAESFWYITFGERPSMFCLTLEEMNIEISKLDQTARNSHAMKLEGLCYRPAVPAHCKV